MTEPAPVRRAASLWLVLSIVCAALVPVTFLLATVTASAAQGPCSGTFAVFHDLARCRWPAIFAKLSLACIGGLAFSVGMAIWTRRSRASSANTPGA